LVYDMYEKGKDNVEGECILKDPQASLLQKKTFSSVHFFLKKFNNT